MTRFTRVCIGLGSNLADPEKQLQLAITALKKLPNTQFVKHSNFHETEPVGPIKQPNFLNAVAVVNTKLSPIELLRALQLIETCQGRVRDTHWGPRTLDLDILLFGDQTIRTKDLTIPHPEMHKRAFVLIPLQEVTVPFARLL